MRNLYFKIFLWFWLAMAVVGTAFVITTVTLQNRDAELRWQSLVSSTLTLSGQSAIERYEADGRLALVDLFERMERRTSLRAYLFDADQRELSGRQPPEDVLSLLAAAAANGELAYALYEDSRVAALEVVSGGEASYFIVAEMDWPYRGAGRRGGGRSGFSRGGSDRGGDNRGGNDRGGGSRAGPRNRTAWYWVWLSLVDQPGELALRLMVVFLTGGILCYGLARYLTAPVLRLRQATRQLSAGDLSVRVGPSLGGRRDELAELGRDFDHMAERIEALLTTQRQLLSDVSHELRSPLARLNVALALARQRAGADAEAPLDRIESEAEQLNALIGRVLTLARLEGGAAEPDMAPVDLGRLVEDVVADADFEARANDATVVAEVVDACRVVGHEMLLRSAIENVVRNAVRYTAAGTQVDVDVSIVGADEIPSPTGSSSDAAVTGDFVLVAVRDRGPGVPEDHLEDLFEPFYRIADSRDRGSGGTGLGLSIAERAVRLHGGVVWARNNPDGGLTMSLALPLEPPRTVS